MKPLSTSNGFLSALFFVFINGSWSALAFSQGWTAQNSGTSNDLYEASFIDATTGWAAGGTGTILHTTDGGTTWIPQNSGTPNVLYDIFFIDATTGWSVGPYGTILHTTNGGDTWMIQMGYDPHNLFGVYFIDANTGWVAGDWQTLLHTTDGGTTWVHQRIDSYRAIEVFDFIDASTGWVSGNEGDIFHTTDTGATWIRQNSGSTESLGGLDFIDAMTGWVVGGEGVILHTTDGGATWIQQFSGTTSFLTVVAFANASTGWAAGGTPASIILHTTDGGVSWIVQETGATIWFEGMSFVDDLNGWVVGFGGTILHTTTGGSTSDPLAQFGVCYGSTGSSEPTNPGALITIDPLTGAGTLIGPTGIVGDNGPSVPALAVKSTGEMYALSAESNSHLYAINATTGAGAFVVSTGLSLPDALAFDANDVLYAVANNNNLYTVDETTGATTLIGPTGFTTKALAYDPTDGTMYGCSATDEIYTVDLTTGASTLVGITGLGGVIHAIHFDQQGNLYGSKGTSLMPYDLISIDKVTGAGTMIGPIGFTAVIGLSGRLVYSPVTVATVDIEIDSLHQFVPAEGDTFAYTMNITNNTGRVQVVDWWTKLLRPDGSSIDPLSGPEILVLDRFETTVIDTPQLPIPSNAIPGEYQLIAFVGRYLTEILHTDTTTFIKLPPITSVGENDGTPQEFSLSQNYPDPFNPSTTIRYALSEDAHVTLKIYNMLGQLVATLVDENQSAGYREVVWSGSNEFGQKVASGIYIYRMTAGSFEDSKRMLLLK